MKKAILIPASMDFTEPRYGSVLHHAFHLGKHGSVFWHVNTGKETVSEFRHPEITTAYFYITSVQKVLYICDVDFIGSTEELDDPKRLIQYVPEWRKEDWKSSMKEPWGYWVLIKDIRELFKPRDYDEFKLFETNQPLDAAPRPYSIIVDPEFESV